MSANNCNSQVRAGDIHRGGDEIGRKWWVFFIIKVGSMGKCFYH